jgi:hypothetical protein
MLNHRHHSVDHDSEDEGDAGSSTLVGKLRTMMLSVCNYLWGVCLILLICLIIISVRGPFNVVHNYNTGKLLKRKPSFFHSFI